MQHVLMTIDNIFYLEIENMRQTGETTSIP